MAATIDTARPTDLTVPLDEVRNVLHNAGYLVEGGLEQALFLVQHAGAFEAMLATAKAFIETCEPGDVAERTEWLKAF